jgi:hypothetical protein
MWGVYDYHKGGVCGRVYVYQGGVYMYQGPKNSLLKANSRMLTFDDDISPISKGAKYFMIITDDYSRYRWFFALKRKSDAKKVLEDWITII